MSDESLHNAEMTQSNGKSYNYGDQSMTCGDGAGIMVNCGGTLVEVGTVFKLVEDDGGLKIETTDTRCLGNRHPVLGTAKFAREETHTVQHRCHFNNSVNPGGLPTEAQIELDKQEEKVTNEAIQ